MAISKKKSISSFVPQKNDVVTLDVNILIKLLYPAMCEYDTSPYTKLYSKLLSTKSKLIMSSIQISEFVNRCIRFQFELYKKAQGNPKLEFKKGYRETDDYRDSMNAILDIIKTDIIPNYSFVDDGFSAMQNDKIFRYGFSYDFNDALVLEIAEKNHAILITDDKDFANYSTSVTIVTNNPGLLMFS